MVRAQVRASRARRFNPPGFFAFAGRGKLLIPCPCSRRPLGAVDAAGGKNLAAHLRSKLLSRSSGIVLTTKAPGSWSPRSQSKGLQLVLFPRSDVSRLFRQARNKFLLVLF
jgi:hypothetical protein